MLVRNLTRKRAEMAMRRARGDRGAAAVEFAIVASLLILLLFGIFDTGMFINANAVVANAVRDGARAAGLGASETSVRAKVTSGVQGVPGYRAAFLQSITMTCTNPTGGATLCTAPNIRGGSVVVTATYTYDWLTPFGLGTTNIVKRSEMIIE